MKIANTPTVANLLELPEELVIAGVREADRIHAFPSAFALRLQSSASDQASPEGLSKMVLANCLLKLATALRFSEIE